MKDYLINVWSSGNFEKLSKEEMGAFFKDFGAWVSDLEQKNQLVTRHRIAGEFSHVKMDSGKPKIFGASHHSGNNGLSGVFIVKAASDEEAFAIATSCPPVRHLNDVAEVVEIAR